MTKFSPMAAALSATAICGTLDVLFAVTMAGLRGVGPNRVLQYISSGLLGKRAYQQGATISALGLMLHFVMMALICTLFVVASRRVPALIQHWPIAGLAYGVGVYLVMTYLVIPASAIGSQPFQWPGSMLQIAAMMLLVGLPTAWFAQHAGM